MLNSNGRPFSQWSIVATGLVVTAIIGAVDLVAGWEVSLFVFYALPIFFVAYHAGLRPGVSFALVSAAIWWLGNKESYPIQSHTAFVWVTITRAAYMVFVAFGANAVRRLRQTEKLRREAAERESKIRMEMLKAAEEQQRSIGRELHDGVCQLLSGTALAIGSLAARLEKTAPQERAHVHEIEGFVRKALHESRALAHGLFPVQMGSEGLGVALEEIVETTNRLVEGTRITFSQDGKSEQIDPQIAMQLYRIAQESLANAVKHSGAENVSVKLSMRKGTTTVEVSDDGYGIMSDEAPAAMGIGLQTMSYRARQIGANLVVCANQLRGTRVICLHPDEVERRND